MEHIWIKPMLNTDFNITQYGEEACRPSHSFGPAVRDHFLLHFVTAGCGRFAAGGKEYRLGAGEGFLIFPNEVAYYEADANEPWQYFWVGFRGDGKVLEEIGITPNVPLFSFVNSQRIERIFREMETADETRADGQLRLIGNLFMLLAEMRAEEKEGYAPTHSIGVRHDYVQHAILYIQQNYALHLTVADIARHLGIHRSYLATIFKEHTCMSPQDFLLWVRTTRACELLQKGHLSILGVAHSVGYEDALLFSRMFKKRTGLSPREYRKRHSKERPLPPGAELPIREELQKEKDRLSV